MLKIGNEKERNIFYGKKISKRTLPPKYHQRQTPYY